MLLYEVQISAIWKKLKPSNVRHGWKNEYFLKIQKGGPSDPPWAFKSKKPKDLDQSKKIGTTFKKVGKKRSISDDFIKNENRRTSVTDAKMHIF